jgi:hypothetical protein
MIEFCCQPGLILWHSYHLLTAFFVSKVHLSTRRYRLKPFLTTQNATAESNGESGPKRIRQIETP